MVFLLSTWVRYVESSGETEDSDGSENEYSSAVEANQRCTPEQLEELAHNVRVVQLSPSYLNAILPHLEWFRGCSGMGDLPVLLQSRLCTLPIDHRDFWSGPPSWYMTLRSGGPSSIVPPNRLNLSIGMEDINVLASGLDIQSESGSFYCNGLYLRLVAKTSKDESEEQQEEDNSLVNDKNTLGVYLFPDWRAMKPAFGHIWFDTRRKIIVCFKFETSDEELNQNVSEWSSVLIDIDGLGNSDFLNRSSSTIEDVITPFLHDAGGPLSVSATIFYVG